MVEEKALTHDELEALMKESATAGDWKAVRQYAKELETLEKAGEQARKEAQLKALADITLKVKGKIDKLVNTMVEAKELDLADGVWYSYDFGTTDTACRLMKGSVKKSAGGNGGGSYIANPAKSSDLLAKVGSDIMFTDDTTVTIDKVSYTMTAGTTYQQAYDFSNNGGWRNRVRMALLKAAGLV